MKLKWVPFRVRRCAASRVRGGGWWRAELNTVERCWVFGWCGTCAAGFQVSSDPMAASASSSPPSSALKARSWISTKNQKLSKHGLPYANNWYIYIYMYMYMYIYICICMYIYICISITYIFHMWNSIWRTLFTMFLSHHNKGWAFGWNNFRTNWNFKEKEKEITFPNMPNSMK